MIEEENKTEVEETETSEPTEEEEVQVEVQVQSEDKNSSSDEYLVLNFVIPFLGGNIISKNFIKNLYNSLITYLVKTLVIYIYHQINQNNIELIEHYLHMDDIINIIINKETPI